jgi:hypothetical protein
MASMGAKRQDKGRTDWRSDLWLWPTALLLMMSGWGQALWMGENVAPEGLMPAWLLLWAGVGVAGATLPIYWLSRRWWLIAWVALGAWAGVPSLYDLAMHPDPATPVSDAGLHGIPLLLLLLVLLGIGLWGAMMSVAWYVGRRWPGPVPKMRPLRAGLWSGLFAAICGWLLSNRAFGLVPAALLAGALILIEIFFVTHESPRE